MINSHVLYQLSYGGLMLCTKLDSNQSKFRGECANFPIDAKLKHLYQGDRTQMAQSYITVVIAVPIVTIVLPQCTIATYQIVATYRCCTSALVNVTCLGHFNPRTDAAVRQGALPRL